MTVLECKICGGRVEPSEDRTYGTCDSCGKTVTLPKVDDDQKAGLFNRGNTFRMRGEFDKAAALFERIIEQDENNTEAHWCLALCRYGIEYVEDPKSGERKPTLHRMSYDLFMNDVDCQVAIEHSDYYTAGLYRDEAERITEIQKKVLTISGKEEPYDVFICYKEKTEGGSRMKDSVIAQDIYYELTNAGYRVFFARITLEDKLGIEYEPYIFAALNSAKVMIAVGTSVENFNAVWVKNEWKRFLALMKNDRSRVLIPCYRGMDPYELPDELSMLQAQDMSKIGFIQDLIRGIVKVLNPISHDTIAKTSVGDSSSNLERLIQNSDTYLKLNNYPAAREVFERITREYPEDHRGWWGLILCDTKGLSEDVDNAVLQQLNTWFSYVIKLSNPNEFKPLKIKYMEYLKIIADSDATDEINRINSIINGLRTSIRKLEEEIQQKEERKKQESYRFDDIITGDKDAISASQRELEKSKWKIPIYMVFSIIFWIAFIICLGVFLNGCIALTTGVNTSAMLAAIVSGFLGYGSISFALIFASNRDLAIKKIDEINKQIQEKQKAQQDNIRYKKVAYDGFNVQINDIRSLIHYNENKIANCDKYLALGRERIIEMLFARRCESVGIEHQFDTTVEQLRNEALKGSSLAEQQLP